MKATMTTDSLRKALEKVRPVKIKEKVRPVKINKMVPVLSNTLLEFADGKGTLTTSDMERVIKVDFECKSDEPFSAVIPLKTTERFLHGENGNMSLQVDGETKEIIMERDDIGQCNLPVIYKLTDFPPKTWAENLVWSQLDAKWFCHMLDIMVLSCAEEGTRPILTGINCKDGAMASADGFRLTVLTDSRLAFGLGDKNVVIPATTANLVRRLFSKEKTLEIAFEIRDAISGLKTIEEIKCVYFKSGDVSMVSQVIQGNFPQYEQLIPESYSFKVSFSAPVIAQRLKMIDEINLSSGITRFSFHQNKSGAHECSMEAGKEDLGKYSLTAPVKIEEGNDGKIAFNYKYILDILRYFAMTTLEISSVSSPGKFTGDIDGLTVVVMPMFVQW